MNDIGKRIKHARETNKLTLEQLAERITARTGGLVTKSLVSQWESGRVHSPSAKNLIALQYVTGYRAEWLINGQTPQTLPKTGSARATAARTPEIDPVLLERITREVLLTTKDANKAAKAIARSYTQLVNHKQIDPLKAVARFAAEQA